MPHAQRAVAQCYRRLKVGQSSSQAKNHLTRSASWFWYVLLCFPWLNVFSRVPTHTPSADRFWSLEKFGVWQKYVEFCSFHVSSLFKGFPILKTGRIHWWDEACKLFFDRWGRLREPPLPKQRDAATRRGEYRSWVHWGKGSSKEKCMNVCWKCRLW